MNDIEERMLQLLARKRMIKFAIREERIRQNALLREQRKQDRFCKLQQEVEVLSHHLASVTRETRALEDRALLRISLARTL